MKKRVTITDVNDPNRPGELLPKTHPLMIEFMRQLDEQDFPADAGPIYGPVSEDSQEYFDRYIAGDR